MAWRLWFVLLGADYFVKPALELDYHMGMRLTIQSHIPKFVVKSPSPQVSGVLEVLPSGHILEKAGFMMNGAIYRRLSMASTSVRNIALTAPSSRLLRTMQDLQQGAVEGIRGVSATELLGSRRRNNAEEDEDEEEIAGIAIDKGDLYYRRRRFTEIEAGQQQLATCSNRIAA